MKPKLVFVAQPFTAPHSTEFFKLVSEVCESMGDEFRPFRADSEPSESGPHLQDRIESYIRRADICVADLCGTRNHNVLLEVGASYTLGIPVIPVSDTDLPSDISGLFYVELKLPQIGDAAMVTQFKTRLRRRFREIQSGVRLLGRAAHFVVHGYASRDVVDFWSLVKRCEERFDLLTTNLAFVVGKKLHCGFDDKDRTLLEMMEATLGDKPPRFTMRILALDPDSNFTNIRAVALGRDRREFREQMRYDLEKVAAFVRSPRCQANVQVKTYDAFPLQMTYFFDDIIVASVVADGRSSRDCVTYLHSLNDSGARETYEQHFERLWHPGIKHVQSSTASPPLRPPFPGEAPGA